MIIDRLKYYSLLMVRRDTVLPALRISLIVGLLLNLINHAEIITDFTFSELRAVPLILTFIVPYLVSSFSLILAKGSFKPGEISRLDAILSCQNCKKTDFTISIGDELTACPNCRENTKWRLKQILSGFRSDTNLLKSLALFARHNPQPIFRLDKNGHITGANPAAEELFNRDSFTGIPIQDLVSELREFDIKGLISAGLTHELIIEVEERHINLLLKGVPSLHMVHAYGTDITEIQKAHYTIREQSTEIMKSIQYASLIQKAILPGDEYLARLFPSHFVFYRPLNIVSGDFYWVRQIDDLRIVAAADSTGHGVPGAFMSMLGISLLNDIVIREKMVSPDAILNEMRSRLISLLSADSGSIQLSDGFDIALVAIDDNAKKLAFAGAHNSLLICRNGSLKVHEADKMPIGKFHGDQRSFTAVYDTFEEGDRLFLFSDGYTDQFGGEKNKKFSKKRFKELIIATDHLSFKEVNERIRIEFENWKSDNSQIDDILVMGIENV